MEFDAVIAKLNEWREQALQQLKSVDTHEEALALKRQIESAMGCLELCQRHQLRPKAQVIVLPEARHECSEYRVMEDFDTDDRIEWAEIEIEGDRVFLRPGDIVLRS